MNRKRLKRAERIRCLFAERGYPEYKRPCAWCPMMRPGEEPNLVTVYHPESDGICPECVELVTKDLPEEE